MNARGRPACEPSQSIPEGNAGVQAKNHRDPYGRLAIVFDPDTGEAVLSGVVSAEMSDTHLSLRTLSGGRYAVRKTDVRFVDDTP